MCVSVGQILVLCEYLIVAFMLYLICLLCCFVAFFFQAEDGIRDLVRSRGLGDVYKRQPPQGYLKSL